MFGVATLPPPAAAADQRASALQARMLAAFAADLPARRAELAGAVARRDQDGAAHVLHGLKGSAAHLQANELQLLAGDLEVAADCGHWESIDAGLPRLAELLAPFDSTATSAVPRKL
ncbi:MAG: histidine kinase [Massilia sp.]|nr:histidine kinase [Massilia sp.]